MANYTLNILTLQSDDSNEIGDIMNYIQGDETNEDSIDFENIAPTPEELKSVSEVDSNAILCYLSQIDPECPQINPNHKYEKLKFNDLLDKIDKSSSGINVKEYLKNPLQYHKTTSQDNSQMISKGKRYVDNIIKYGAAGWYQWRLLNWGTSHDAYDTYSNIEADQKSATIEFQTTWSPADKVIAKLAKEFPHVKMTLQYADEAYGNYCGQQRYENGELVEDVEYENNSNEAFEFSIKVWNGEDATPEEYGYVLNKAGTYYINVDAFWQFELITVNGEKALFSNIRLTEEDIPPQAYVYDIRGSDEDPGSLYAIEEIVTVNHAGSIITKAPLDFGQEGFLYINRDNEANSVDLNFEGIRGSISQIFEEEVN